LSLRPRSPPPQQSRGTKRVVRSASPQTLSEKRARSVGITAGNAFRAEVGSMAEKVRRTSEDARRGVEDTRKGLGGEKGREWRDAERMEESKRGEKARHRKEEEDKLKEVGGKEARRKVTGVQKDCGVLKIAVGRVA